MPAEQTRKAIYCSLELHFGDGGRNLPIGKRQQLGMYAGTDRKSRSILKAGREVRSRLISLRLVRRTARRANYSIYRKSDL